ncbi:response regulator transcription factor [Paenibacillus thalictri]|uniref:Response regulator n=1 Tax=Paenibacillus thalictri TaxID=2527873 RepID=A0A4Q9DQH7_9BACL|nr:response regulator [Paenibacillus thalictri]TBL76346.1 response regulator [Paenibacillus thalictri]
MFKLLIVDDEKSILENLSTTYPWEEIGIDTVYTAASAGEALRLIELHTIHIMITDIRMPRINGLDLLDQVWQASPKTRCILLSGYSDFQYAQRAVSAHAEAYLLKPVKSKELLSTVSGVIEKIKAEWNEIVSQQRILYTLNEHLPLLKGALLNDLLQGKYIPRPELSKKLDMLGVSIGMAQPFAMMFIRMEQGFDGYDDYSRSLLEFGICNIGDEIFGADFGLWHCKDVNDNLVFIVTEKGWSVEGSDPGERNSRKMLEKHSLQLKESVSLYLKGSISVLISEWGNFPDDVYTYYQRSNLILRSHPDNVQGFFINSLRIDSKEQFQPLRSVQEPPMLWNLLEAGRWELAENKFEAMMEELKARKRFLHEHICEVAALLRFSVTQTIHKQGRMLEEFGDFQLSGHAGYDEQRSVASLERWGFRMIQAIKEDAIKEAKSNQRSIIQKINEFVQMNLEYDVSLQSIAEHVYLHPVYVSKIYKLETGEGISEYVYRLRMERAAHLLSETSERIQEIARKAGYQNPSHFSRVFRKYFDMTPDEYREKDR